MIHYVSLDSYLSDFSLVIFFQMFWSFKMQYFLVILKEQHMSHKTVEKQKTLEGVSEESLIQKKRGQRNKKLRGDPETLIFKLQVMH